MPRPYVRREALLLEEWVKKTYPDKLQWFRVRLGPAVFKGEEKLYQMLRRWANAVVFTGKEVLIIEAKMRPMPEGIAELELYRDLFPQTPEFKAFWKYPVKLIYLTTWEDKAIKGLCEKKGIEYVVYRPPWAEEYIRKTWGVVT